MSKKIISNSIKGHHHDHSENNIAHPDKAHHSPDATHGKAKRRHQKNETEHDQRRNKKMNSRTLSIFAVFGILAITTISAISIEAKPISIVPSAINDIKCDYIGGIINKEIIPDKAIIDADIVDINSDVINIDQQIIGGIINKAIDIKANKIVINKIINKINIARAIAIERIIDEKISIEIV